MIKSTTTVAKKSLLLTVMALFALTVASMADIPDTMFIGILLLFAITSSVITVYLIENKDKDK